MSYADLAKGRYSQGGQIYFVTTVLADRSQRWFEAFSLARLVVNEMRKLDECGTVHSMAWVVMPDHVHWLFQLGDAEVLSSVIKGFKARSAHQVNRHLQRSGSVWQKAFYDHALRQDDDVRDIARYIVANPLRAGLVAQIGDYPLWDAIWL